jgi:hypothetical protein
MKAKAGNKVMDAKAKHEDRREDKKLSGKPSTAAAYEKAHTNVKQRRERAGD